MHLVPFLPCCIVYFCIVRVAQKMMNCTQYMIGCVAVIFQPVLLTVRHAPGTQVLPLLHAPPVRTAGMLQVTEPAKVQIPLYNLNC